MKFKPSSDDLIKILIIEALNVALIACLNDSG